MPVVYSCPSAEELQLLAVGRKAPEEIATFASHLEQCAQCAERLEKLSVFIALLPEVRRAAQVEPAYSPDELEALRRQALSPTPETPNETTLFENGSPRDTLGQAAAQAGAAMRSAPTKIGRFEIRRELGEGAFGKVYEAHDPQLDRAVALKVAKLDRGDSADRIKRFLREAKSAANLRHPHIVPLYEYGQDGDQFYIAAAFIQGKTLADDLKSREPDLPRAARLIRQLAEALGYAHSQGIVHRDVKPANTMLDHNDEPLVMDFGLATRQEDAEKLTHAGQVMGTPRYMAPEQAKGASGPALPASDQYSLGVMLFEMITGQAPFKGTVEVVMFHHMETEPPRPSKLNPAISRDLETICLKCLEKDPTKRYASCQALADDLRHLLDGEPIMARRIGAIERGVKWMKRRPLVSALLVLLALVTIGSFAAILGQLDQTEQARQAADDNAKSFKSASEEAARNAEKFKEASTAAGLAAKKAELAAVKANKAADSERTALVKEKKHLYVAHMSLVQQAWERGDMPTVRSLLDLHIPPPGETTDNRGWEWYYYWRLLHSDLYTLRNLPGPVRSIAFAPTKWSLKEPTPMLLAIACANGSVLLWDANARTPPKTLKNMRVLVRCLAFSPDGKTLAWATGTIGQPGVITLWDMEKGAERKVLKGHKYPVSALAFSPDGTILATAAVQLLQNNQGDAESSHQMTVGAGNLPGEIKLWNPATADELAPLKGAVDGVLSLGFLQNGKYLLAGTASRGHSIWEMASRNHVGSDGFGYSRWSMAIHPNGNAFASAGAWGVHEGYVSSEQFHSESGRLYASLQLPGHRQGVLACAFSPDGQIVATAGYDRIIRIFDKYTRKVTTAYRGHADGVQALAFSPDGRILASGSWDRSVKLWDIGSAQEWTVLETSTRSGYQAIRFSQDGRLLVAVGFKGPTKLWHWPSRELVKQFETVDKLLLTKDNRVIVGRLNAGEFSFVEVKNDAETPLGTIKTGPLENWAVSDDFKWLATCSYGKAKEIQVKLWDLATKREHAQLPLPNNPGLLRGLEFSPDGRTLAGATWHSHLLLWDVSSGRPLAKPLQLPGGLIGEIAFSPDSKLMATVGSDHMARLWDPADLRELHVFKGHDSNLFGAAFSRDGRTLATGGWDRQVKLWDVESREELLTLRMPSGGVADLAFSLDGKTLVGACSFDLLSWQAAKSVHDTSPPKRADRAAWHQQQAESASWTRQPHAVRFHLDALREEPNSPKLLVLRLHAVGASADWKKIKQEMGDLFRNETVLKGTAELKKDDIHEVNMKAGSVYVIDMESNDFDAFLRLEDMQGKKLDENDDVASGNLNSRLIFAAPHDGVYRIVATSFQQAGQGAYTVTIREFGGKSTKK